MTWRIRSCLTSCWVSLRAGLRAAPVRGGSPPLPAAGPEHPRRRGSSLRHRRALPCSLSAPGPGHPAAASLLWPWLQPARCCISAAELPQAWGARCIPGLSSTGLVSSSVHGRRYLALAGGLQSASRLEVSVSALSAPEQRHLSRSPVENHSSARHFPPHLCVLSPVLLPPGFGPCAARMVQVVPACSSQASALHPLRETHLPRSNRHLQCPSTKKSQPFAPLFMLGAEQGPCHLCAGTRFLLCHLEQFPEIFNFYLHSC